MQTQAKRQRGATRAQLAHRAEQFKAEALKEVLHVSAALDGYHAMGNTVVARGYGDFLIDAMAEAGL